MKTRGFYDGFLAPLLLLLQREVHGFRFFMRLCVVAEGCCAAAPLTFRGEKLRRGADVPRVLAFGVDEGYRSGGCKKEKTSVADALECAWVLFRGGCIF